MSREKSVQDPVGGQAQLTVQTWKFRYVNPAPKQPGEEALKTETKNLRNGRAPAREPSFSSPVNANFVFFAAHRGHDILRASLGLAQSVLCGWR